MEISFFFFESFSHLNLGSSTNQKMQRRQIDRDVWIWNTMDNRDSEDLQLNEKEAVMLKKEGFFPNQKNPKLKYDIQSSDRKQSLMTTSSPAQPKKVKFDN